MRNRESQPIREALLDHNELWILDRAAEQADQAYTLNDTKVVCYQDEHKFIILNRDNEGLVTVFRDCLTVVDIQHRSIWQYRLYRQRRAPHTPQFIQLYERTGNEESPWRPLEQDAVQYAANMRTYLSQIEPNSFFDIDDFYQSYRGILMTKWSEERLSRAKGIA